MIPLSPPEILRCAQDDSEGVPIASRIDLGYTREGITQKDAIINISSSDDEEE